MKQMFKLLCFISFFFVGCKHIDKNKFNNDKKVSLVGVNKDTSNLKKEIKPSKNQLPNEISNTKWILLEEDELNDQRKIIETMDTLLYVDFIEYRSLLINNIQQTSDGYLIYIDQIADLIKFTWVNKIKGIAKWDLQYKEGKIIRTYFTKKEGFYVSPKASQHITDSAKQVKNLIFDTLSIDSTKYDKEGLIEPTGFYQYSNNKGVTNIINGDNILLVLNKDLSIITTSRRIKGFDNKYALFFKKVYETNLNFEEKNYSKVKCIAELEILSAEEIKKKWIGLYNNKTGKIESKWANDWDVSESNKLIYWE